MITPEDTHIKIEDLGLLRRCITRATVFEPFRNASSARDIRACVSKL